MDKLDPKIDGASKDIVAENVAKLKELFPEVFTEDKIDFDVLKEVLDEYVEDREERYSFTWHGKSRARRIAQTPSTGTLRPVPEESVNWETTQHLFIEGDNLEVLKLLQKSYHKKIKMIYIDPPYNTGKEFIYPDKFHDTLETYLRYTGQIDERGLVTSSNPETSGRYHTNWLNMMYPRLKLARNLLREDGVIFISIDDHEVANLRKLCDEIFGEDNFEGHVHWRRRKNQPNDPTKMIGLVAEHILIYAKDSKSLKAAGVGKVSLTGSFSNPDNDPRGPWATKPWKVAAGQSGTRYKIQTPTGKILDEEWMGDESTFRELLKDNRIYWPRGGDGAPRKKYFKFERELEGQCATNWWTPEQFGSNQDASKELAELMKHKNVFSNPKPVELLKNMLDIANVKPGDIVLDFFAGSCPLFEAVVEHMPEARCICVQLPERLDPRDDSQRAGYEFCLSQNLKPTIAELAKERMRRVVEKIQSIPENLSGSGVNDEHALGNESLERSGIGFKVFKLDTSNIKLWDPNIDQLQYALLAAVDNLKSNRSELDVLYELLLKQGLDLVSQIEERIISGQRVFVVAEGTLVVCLGDNVDLSVAQGILELKDEFEPEIMRVIFKDSGFRDDVVKTNTVQMLQRVGVDRVVSV